MGFNAGRAVSPLDYDFSAYVEGAKGTIPEPTQDELEVFLDALGTIAESEQSEERSDAETLDTIRQALSDDGLVKQFWPKVLDALDPICKGTPSRDQIEALPARVRFAFFDWLSSEFVDPTKPSATTRR